VDGGSLVVTIDGAALFTTAVAAIPATALAGFSAGTGKATDVHTVTDLHLAF
jgi:hypothetical protein